MKFLVFCSFVLGMVLIFSCNDEDSKIMACPECSLIPNEGPCNAAFVRYYFDTAENKCKEFTWGGCDGVVPFETLEECEGCGC